MQHTFTKTQLLNITTGFLHTKMEDIYDFFNKVIHPGIMTHQLHNARKAILPILKQKLDLPFDGFHPKTFNEEISFEFTEEDMKQFETNFINGGNLLEGKQVIVV